MGCNSAILFLKCVESLIKVFEGAFNKYVYFFVQAFKIVVDS